MPDLTKMSWDLLLVDGNKALPESKASVRFYDALGKLRVALCLSPKGTASGSYSGTLTFAGSGVAPQQIPLTVNLKDRNLFLIWLGIIGAAFTAVFIKWWTTKVTDKNAPNGAQIGLFFKWLRAQWVTVAIAVVSAAGGIYVSMFRDAEAFTPDDRWALWGATFTTVMSASMLLNALGLAVEPKKGDKPKTAH